ncbi:S8 family serine peptidase [Gallaecimonas kandeliae]|uniref:S8 family serine peptidase n=1 Tax=Gallaecimonas kandeliae TaxID=3029055 RepID=UPI00264867EC|nr:S8 family serine peptidase [Gallaecimonas kandeliae]WKE64842.1 S8 family serine peptidase [Gallaecimonas kandeliae]
MTKSHLALRLAPVALALCASLNSAPALAEHGMQAPFVAQKADQGERYIVRFKERGNMSIQAMNHSQRLARASENANLVLKHGGKVKNRMARFNAIGAKLTKAQLKAMKADPSVAYIEPDPIRKPLASSLGEIMPWGVQKVQAAGTLGNNAATGRKVCIIDTGFYLGHPDLTTTNVSGEGNSATGDWSKPGASHGTHVAGTIAGIANNGEGVVGIFPADQVAIYSVKVFDNDGNWPTASDLVTAAEDCASHGANVINMSLGGGASSTTESNAFAQLLSDGVLSIAASGNGGDSTLSYPASYDSVVSVGAVDNNEQWAYFSQYNNQVELSAPGVAIRSTVIPGDGREADLVVGGASYAAKGVVPQTRYTKSGTSYVVNDFNGTVTAPLASCTTSGTSASCSGASGKICVVERTANEDTSGYPEVNAVAACASAGGVGAVVYSKSSLPGLQNNFLVDANGVATFPVVSVDRATGLELAGKAGQSATLTVTGNADYEYYNGTSMATPHVAGVAALVWSYFPSCSATQIRSALDATAKDLGTAGRDNYYGYGLVQAQDAVDYLNANGCDGGGSTGGGSDNSVNESNLSASYHNWVYFPIQVPAGATSLNVAISGGTGDADLYVRKGSQPTTSSYNCRPYLTGNNESCAISSPAADTWYIGIRAYAAFSGVNLTATAQ